MHFKNLNLIIPIIRAATEAGYAQPARIQSQAIPHILGGKDILGFAENGYRAAFVMPVIQLMKKKNQDYKEIRVLILTPTRATATETEDHFKLYSKYLPLSQLSVFGGVSQGSQISELRKRVDILTATPERLLDLCGKGHVSLAKIEILVLDDAGQMLDMGFASDIRNIIKLLPQKRQTLLFSAVVTDAVRKLAAAILNQPVEITANSASAAAETFAEQDKKTELPAKASEDLSVIWSSFFTRQKVKNGNAISFEKEKPAKAFSAFGIQTIK